MRTEYLRYFLVAASAKSFTKAAEELHLSQQGLSRIIKLLEAEYECTLFVRGTSQTELTSSGKKLRTLAEEVVSSYDKLERVMLRQSAVTSGKSEIKHVTIEMTLNVMHNIYPMMVEPLAVAFPNVRINPVEIDTNVVIDRLTPRQGGHRLLFVSMPEFKLFNIAKNMDVEFRPLLDTELDCIVGKKSSFASRKYFSWSDVGKYEFVFKKDPAMLDLLRARKVIFRASDLDFWTTDTKLVEAILNSRDSVSFSTSFLGLYPELDQFKHIPLRNSFKTPIGFIFNKNEEFSPEAQNVISFIEKFFVINYSRGLFPRDEVIAGRWRPVTAEIVQREAD